MSVKYEPASETSVTSHGEARTRFLRMNQGEDWWRHGIFYQIYPRSFQDSNGDGVGDIKGIIGRLPYLRSLGADAVWLSPIFPSPMADFGDDISDDTCIDPL